MSLPRQGPRPMSSVSLCRACECTLCCAAGTGGDGAGGGASSGPPGAGGAGGAAWCWSWGMMLDMALAHLRTDRRMHTRTKMRTHARTHARTRAQPHTKRTHACTHARAPSPPLKHHLGSSHIHGPPVPKRRRPPAELHSTQCESRPATHAKPCVAAGWGVGCVSMATCAQKCRLMSKGHCGSSLPRGQSPGLQRGRREGRGDSIKRNAISQGGAVGQLTSFRGCATAPVQQGL